MKLSVAALSLLALVGSSTAQYFSAGWTPGQKQQPQEPEVATFVPVPEEKATTAAQPKAAPFSFSNLFDINKLLTSEPAVAIFNRMGINITEKVQAALDHKIWDERVELITDDNYKELIVDEPLTEQQEKDRVWILVISVTSAKQDGVSKFLDEVFDSAFNQTQLAGDLPNVKWGRIDYLNVTHITTKWGIWQAPYLVVLQDRGKTLRFYRPYQLRLKDDALREFLAAEGWKVTPPWSTAYSPGGSREFIMEFFAVWMTKLYNLAVVVPRWLLVLVSGSLASVIIGLLHKPAKKPATPLAVQPQPKVKSQSAVAASSKPAAASSSTASAIASGSGQASVLTDSERESSAPPTKRTSARQRKTKK
ncbi:hypothetical protein B0H34DRAFT_690040 [Crassisporium funariophilum]|nr:hypothetical protein B0H34DRAFT_690040 [Crassisporium funariophilum]